MRTIYLTDNRKFSYHRDLIKDFIGAIPGDIMDMSDGTDFGVRYAKIRDMAPDVVITFDLAGHVLRTGSDTLSLNNIHARMAHILFHKTDYYGSDLKPRQNLSMFTYIPVDEEADACRERFREVPNISSFVHINYKACNEAEHKENALNIAAWWEVFKEDAML